MIWNVEYDDKITTPPGLYIMSSLLLTLTGRHECTPSSLRLINIAFQSGTLLIIVGVLSLLGRERRSRATGQKEKKAAESDNTGDGCPQWSVVLMRTTMLITSPVHFFCGFLYYTDSSSTFFVLFSYYLSLRETVDVTENQKIMERRTIRTIRTTKSTRSTRLTRSTLCVQLTQFVVSSLVGLCSLACRQNNVVWSAFCIGTVLVAHINFHDENEVANETLRTTQRPSRKNGVHSKKSSLKNR